MYLRRGRKGREVARERWRRGKAGIGEKGRGNKGELCLARHHVEAEW